MAQLEIQKYIAKFPDILTANLHLRNKLGLKIKKDRLLLTTHQEETVYIYNYHLINSPKDHPIVKEARALILDEKANVVSFSFQRFFNYGEPEAADIDWGSSVAETKHDGTLIVIYNHRGKWFIQTRQSAMADGPVGVSGLLTYRQAVTAVLDSKNPGDPFKGMNDCCCYAFEFVSPYNRIVTPYDETELILLSIFDKHSLMEYDGWLVEEVATKFEFKYANSFFVEKAEYVLEKLETIKDLDEGFVVVDENRNRIKMKNQRYLATARVVNAGNETSPKNLAKLVLLDKANKVMEHFPEFKNKINFFKRIIDDICEEAEALWYERKDLPSKKLFALSIEECPLSSILFSLWEGEISSVKEGVLKLKPEALVNFARQRRPYEFKDLFITSNKSYSY